MKHITSLHSSWVKDVVALHDKKGRSQQKLFLVEGLRSCEAFLKAGWQPVRLFLTEQVLDSAASLVEPYARDITLVSSPVMRKMSASVTPSGILALFRLPESTLQPISRGIVLAEISDPGNMGTLIRTAAAMGVSVVLVVGGCDPWSPKVVQASAGALALLSVIELTWDELINVKGSLPLCALVAQGGKRAEQLDLRRALLVVGNEAHGIPPAWLEQCAMRLTLPMQGMTESLNAAVAGSIALYVQLEQIRSRG